jgi:hypothetical protein
MGKGEEPKSYGGEEAYPSTNYSILSEINITKRGKGKSIKEEVGAHLTDF